MDKNSKKKDQRKRAFLAAMAMLLVSAIVLTTASFAWFKLGKTVAVETMQLKVTAGDGIVISANTSAWTQKLTIAEIKGEADDDYTAYAGNTNNIPEFISPASSSFNASGSTLPAFFMGSIGLNADAKNVMTSTAAADEINAKDLEDGAIQPGYYAFDVFVRYVGDQETIEVNVGDSKVQVKENTDDATVEQDAKVEDAMRIGFVNLGTVTSATAAGSVSKTVVFAKNAPSTNPVTSAGESAELADDAYTVSSANAGSLTVAGSYSGVATDQAANAQMTLSNGINKIRVYIWMEGQDANCTNALMSQWVDATISFKMV